MKIAVCAKYVPEATAARRIDPQTKRVDRSGEGALNPFDVNAVEEALRLKEAGEGEVVIVSLGPERALEAMRRAPPARAARSGAVRRGGAAARPRGRPTGRAPGAGPGGESPDFVLFGQRGTAADVAVLWAAVGERLQR